MEKLYNTQLFCFFLAVLGMYLMVVIYRIGYVGRVRQLVYGLDEEKYKKLPGFFVMTWIQIFKHNYLKELFGDEYNDKDYLAD